MESEIWDREELELIIKYEKFKRNKAALALMWDLDSRKLLCCAYVVVVSLCFKKELCSADSFTFPYAPLKDFKKYLLRNGMRPLFIDHNDLKH